MNKIENKNKFKTQDKQYQFPYHHLVDLENFNIYKTMVSGVEYYGYMGVVLEFIRSSNFSSLLDVGCGDGKMIFEIAKTDKQKKLVGVDLSERSIMFARAFNYENNAEFYYKPVSEINETFDIVTVIEILEHIPNSEIVSFVKELRNKLKQEGCLIVSVPSVNFPIHRKHYRHYTLEALKKHLEGFELQAVQYRIKNGKLYWGMIRLSNKLCQFTLMRNIIHYMSKRFLFTAEQDSGRHIVAIFKKTEK